MLTASGDRLIDFNNFENNSFHVLTELIYKNGGIPHIPNACRNKE